MYKKTTQKNVKENCIEKCTRKLHRKMYKKNTTNKTKRNSKVKTYRLKFSYTLPEKMRKKGRKTVDLTTQSF